MKAAQQTNTLGDTNEELMDRFYRGASEAFGTLAERLGPGLIGHALSRLPAKLAGRHQLAEDLVQQTFIKVMITQNRQESRWKLSRGKVSTWIGTILRNTVTSYLRTRGSKIPVSTDLLLEQTGNHSELPENRIVDHRLHSERTCYDRERRCARWREAIQRLPKLDESMVQMQLQGKSHREISRRLGMARSTVTYRIKNAHTLLRNMAAA